MGKKRLDLQSVFEALGEYAGGQDRPGASVERARAAPVRAKGACAGLFTANTMACLTEAMGMSLVGCGTSLADSRKKREIARATGRRIVELVKQNMTPRGPS